MLTVGKNVKQTTGDDGGLEINIFRQRCLWVVECPQMKKDFEDRRHCLGGMSVKPRLQMEITSRFVLAQHKLAKYSAGGPHAD